MIREKLSIPKTNYSSFFGLKSHVRKMASSNNSLLISGLRTVKRLIKLDRRLKTSSRLSNRVRRGATSSLKPSQNSLVSCRALIKLELYANSSKNENPTSHFSRGNAKEELAPDQNPNICKICRSKRQFSISSPRIRQNQLWVN